MDKLPVIKGQGHLVIYQVWINYQRTIPWHDFTWLRLWNDHTLLIDDRKSLHGLPITKFASTLCLSTNYISLVNNAAVFPVGNRHDSYLLEIFTLVWWEYTSLMIQTSTRNVVSPLEIYPIWINIQRCFKTKNHKG